MRYDFVLCANVLSAIPSRQLQARSLRAIRASLSNQGECLFVNQHTNSYFRHARESLEATNHLDGWVLRSSRGASYYGILARDKILRILKANGFQVQKDWVDGQSTFVLAGRSAL